MLGWWILRSVVDCNYGWSSLLWVGSVCCFYIRAVKCTILTWYIQSVDGY